MERYPVFLIDDDFGTLDWRVMLGVLPQWRRERVMRLQRESDRRQSVAAWLLLRRCCHELLGLDDVPDVAHMANGKPYFPTLPDVHFNLSHCPEAVACVMADEPIGVDIEAVTPFDIDVARHVLSDNELSLVLADQCPPIAFMRLWTMKESLLKLTGEGISNDLKPLLTDIDVTRFRTTVDVDGRWVCTVCAVTPWT